MIYYNSSSKWTDKRLKTSGWRQAVEEGHQYGIPLIVLQSGEGRSFHDWHRNLREGVSFLAGI